MVTSTSEMPSLNFLLVGGRYRFQNSKERFSKVWRLKSFPLIASPRNFDSQIFGSRFFKMPNTFAVRRSSLVVRTLASRDWVKHFLVYRSKNLSHEVICPCVINVCMQAIAIP